MPTDTTKTVQYMIALLPPDKHEAVAERAAICEYMGNMSRDDAEVLAWNEFSVLKEKQK